MKVYVSGGWVVREKQKVKKGIGLYLFRVNFTNARPTWEGWVFGLEGENT